MAMPWYKDGRFIFAILTLAAIVTFAILKIISGEAALGAIFGLLGGLGIAGGKAAGKGLGVLSLLTLMILSPGCASWQTQAEDIITKGKTCMHQCAQKCIMTGVTRLVQGDLQGGYEASAACVEECVKVCALSTAGQCLIK